MPIIESAKKALRGSRKKRDFNLARKKTLALAIKNFKKLIAENKSAEAKAFMPKLQKELDKSAKIGLLKDNTAARKKSRFVAMIKKLS